MHVFHGNFIGHTKVGNPFKHSLFIYITLLSPGCHANSEKEKPVLIIQISELLAFAWLIFKGQELTGKELRVGTVFQKHSSVTCFF